MPSLHGRGASAMLAALIFSSCSGGGSRSSSPLPTSTTPAATAAPRASPRTTARRCWPIVLVHGIGGFRRLGPIPYWFRIPETLRANGFTVHVTDETSVATIEERARQLRDQVLATFPDPRTKINFIGHSMGGLDIRWAVSNLGLASRTASVTTIATPHRGSSLADVAFGLVPGPMVDAANVMVGVVGWDLNGARELTTWNMADGFNPRVPDEPGVAYFSWAGEATLLGSRTSAAIDFFLAPSGAIVSSIEGANDGIVSVASAKWGDFRGTVPADHFQEVGQPLGLSTSLPARGLPTPASPGPRFDHETFYESWAEELERRGFGP